MACKPKGSKSEWMEKENKIHENWSVEDKRAPFTRQFNWFVNVGCVIECVVKWLSMGFIWISAEFPIDGIECKFDFDVGIFLSNRKNKTKCHKIKLSIVVIDPYEFQFKLLSSSEVDMAASLKCGHASLAFVNLIR